MTIVHLHHSGSSIHVAEKRGLSPWSMLECMMYFDTVVKDHHLPIECNMITLGPEEMFI